MKTLNVALLFIAFAAYASAETGDSSGITQITLERTACYGTCPIYTVTLRRDGTVTYEGQQFVKEIGQRTGKISPSEFRRLARQVELVDFFALEDEYVSKKNPDGTTTRVTDLPTTLTTVIAGQRQKTVKDYFGGPESLRRLEKLIDQISNSTIWVKGKT